MYQKKYLFFSLLVCLLVFGLGVLSPAWANKKPNSVSISSVPLLSGLCAGGGYRTLGDIVFVENANDDIKGGNGTNIMEVTIPTEFELETTPSVLPEVYVERPKNSSQWETSKISATITLASDKAILTFSFTSGHDTEKNRVTISGLRVKAKATAQNGLSDIKYTLPPSSTLIITGLTSGTSVLGTLEGIAIPTLINGYTQIFCVNANASSSLITIANPANLAGAIYRWRSADETIWYADVTNDISLQTLAINTTVEGTHTRIVASAYTCGSNGGNCTSRSPYQTVTIKIVAPPSLVYSFSANGNLYFNDPAIVSICSGQTISYAGWGGNSNVPITISVDEEPTNAGNTDFPKVLPLAGNVASITATAAGGYHVGVYKVTITAGSSGCVTTSYANFQVNAGPTINYNAAFSPSSYQSDQAAGVDLKALIAPTPNTGTFSGNGVSGGLFYPQTAGIGTHTMTYTVTSGGCSSSIIFDLIVKAPSNYVDAGYCQDGGIAPASGDCGNVISVLPASTTIDSGGGGILPPIPIFIIDLNSNPLAFDIASQTFNPAIALNNPIPAGQDFSVWKAKLITANGCEYVVSTKIFRAANPKIEGKLSACQEETTTYVTNPHPQGDYTWQIDPNKGTIVDGQGTASVTIKWVATGTHTITLVQKAKYTSLVASYPTCSKTITQNVVVKETPPSVSINAPSSTSCEGDLVSYSVPSVTGYTYKWTVGANGGIIGADDANTVQIKWFSAGVGVGNINVKISSNGCDRDITKTIALEKLPTPNFSNTPVCVGETKTYNVAGTPSPNSVYTWAVNPPEAEAGTPSSNVGTQKTITWAQNISSATLTLTEKNANNCTGSITQTVVLNALPLAQISGGTEACKGVNFQLGTPADAKSSGGYSWGVFDGKPPLGMQDNDPLYPDNLVSQSKADIQNGGTSQPTFYLSPNLSLNKVYIRLRKINDAGCVSEAWKVITVNTSPPMNVTGNTSVCKDATVTYTDELADPNQTGVVYYWEISPANAGVVVGGNTSSTFQVNWKNVGAAKVTLRKTTACDGTDFVDVFVNDVPTTAFSVNEEVCAYGNPNGTEASYTASGSGLDFVWKVTGNGNVFKNPAVLSNPTTTTGQDVTVIWKSTGSVKVVPKRTYPSGVECVGDTIQKRVTVIPVTGASIIGQTSVCGDYNGVNNNPRYSYTYQVINTQGYNVTWISQTADYEVDPSSTDPSTATVVWKVNENPTGSQRVLKVKLARTAQPSCEEEIPLSVVVNQTPRSDIAITNLCHGSNTSFTATSVAGSDVTFEWSFDADPTTFKGPTVEKIFTQTGFHKVHLKAIGDHCEYKKEQDFTIYPMPKPAFDYVGSCFGSPTVFTDASTIDAVAGLNGIASWKWEFGDTQSVTNTSGATVNHTYATTGMFNVTLTTTSENGCSKSITKTISIFPQETPTEAVPYNHSFNAGTGNWIPSGVNSSWKYGAPQSSRTIDATGNIWGTGLEKNYDSLQISYLESPCFNLENLNRPHIAIKMWMDVDTKNDGAVLQVTDDDGKTWSTLGDVNEGLNWYDMQNILGFPSTIFGDQRGWSRKDKDWVTVRYPLDAIKANHKNVRFRVVFASNADNPKDTFDGIGIASVFVGSRNRIVLLENFTRANANKGITDNQAAIKTFPGTQDEIVKMQYITNFALDINDKTPDKLYKDNPAEPGARALYYAVNTLPKAVINGISTPTADTTSLKRDYSRDVLMPAPFQITIDFPATTTTGELKIRVKVKALEAINEPLLIHTVLMEKAITGANAGVPSVPVYEYIMKKMLPSAAGLLDRNTWAAGEERTYEQTVSLYEASSVLTNGMLTKIYDKNEVQVVAFLQSDKDKKVYQAATGVPTVPALATANEPTLKLPDMRIYPNPANEQVTLNFGEALRENCTWELYNTLGVVASKGRFMAGTEESRIQTDKLPRGMYLLKITEDKSKNAVTYKLVLR